MSAWASLGLVLVFIVVGGIFAGTEIALISLRESQLRGLEQRSARGARVAAVARDPNRFLAAVQIGVTVAGFFSAAYGAAALAPVVAPWLENLGLSAAAADSTALIGLTLFVAYLSLVLGELVPKRLALQRSTAVSLIVAPPLDRFATLVRPVIWLLSRSTNAVVRLLGGDPRATEEAMTDEEVRDVVLGHQTLPEDERKIMADVLEAGSRSLTEVMRPRGEVSFVDADRTVAQAVEAVRERPWSRYPVIGESFDDVLGFVHVRDLLEAVTSPDGAGPEATVADVMREVLFLPGTNGAIPSITLLRRAGVHIAVVLDEYGGTDGIVTLEDLVEELVGEIRDEYDPAEEESATGEGPGVTLVDARITIEEFAERCGVELPEGPYETVGGFVVARLSRLAKVGDVVEASEDARIEVREVGKRRVLRVAVHSGASGAEAGAAHVAERTPSQSDREFDRRALHGRPLRSYWPKDRAGVGRASSVISTSRISSSAVETSKAAVPGTRAFAVANAVARRNASGRDSPRSSPVTRPPRNVSPLPTGNDPIGPRNDAR
ncbi:membrane protein [Paraoerskovia sediminicola]|uniref:Membrane protein n=1 Tax=Paraoerskovia sediminicola TaxID=1138587 RepID=A0ABN6XBC9_9CELL|nr:membrane protein [Paraoerskovia sediminicola]